MKELLEAHNSFCYNNNERRLSKHTLSIETMIDKEELNYWKETFPSLTEEEITDILEEELTLLWKTDSN